MKNYMDKKFIITIGREFGTGGRQIAMDLGNLLGVKVYDRKLLDALKEKYNLTQEEARETFTQTFSEKSRYDARNYDLVLNVSGLDPKSVAEFIAGCVRQKIKI